MPCIDYVDDGAPALIVTYQLRVPADDYQKRDKAIRRYLETRFPDHLFLAPSSWILKTDLTPTALYFDDLKKKGRVPELFDEADRLLIDDLRGARWEPHAGDTSLPYLPDWLADKKNVFQVIRLARRSPIFSVLTGAVHPASSTWFLETEELPDVVFKRLRDAIDQRDVLVVNEHVPGLHQNCSPPDPPGVIVTYQRHKLRPTLGERLTSKRHRSPLLLEAPPDQPLWWHNMANVWLVAAKGGTTAMDLVDDLRSSIMSYDGLFVSAFKGPQARKGDVACIPPAKTETEDDG